MEMIKINLFNNSGTCQKYVLGRDETNGGSSPSGRTT